MRQNIVGGLWTLNKQARKKLHAICLVIRQEY